MSSNNENASLLKLFVGILFYGAILVGFGGYVYISFFGNPFQSAMPDNMLEKATNVGKSTRAQMDAFKSAGGLDGEASWKGYHTGAISTVYDEDGKLAMLDLKLHKTWPQMKLASVDNLQRSLAKSCGSEWEVDSSLNVTKAVAAHPSSGKRCSVMDQGGDYVFVNVSRGERQASAAKPVGQGELKPAPEQPTVAQTNQSASPLVAVAPTQFVGRFEGPGDGGAVTANIAKNGADEGMTVSISIAGSGCAGSVEGRAAFEGPALRLNAKDGELRCTATMQFNAAGQLVLEEGDGCHQFRSAQCAFSAELAKVSSTPQLPTPSTIQPRQPATSVAPQRSVVEDEACTRAQARCREKSPALAQACLNALASARGCS